MWNKTRTCINRLTRRLAHLFFVSTFLLMMICLFGNASSGEEEVVVSEENVLVYKGQFGHVRLPAPEKNWEWLEGGVTKKEGVAHKSYFCRDPSTGATFIFMLSRQKKTTFNEKFMSGFIKGYKKGMEDKGWKLAEFEITPSAILLEGSYRFVAEYLDSEGTRLYQAGYIGSRDKATKLYTFMYHTFEPPDWKILGNFAAGLELLSE